MKTIFIAVFTVLASSCCGLYYNDARLEDVLKRDGTVVNQKCQQPIDLALLLDSSNSISKNNWQEVKKFAKKVVDSIGDVSEKGSHVSVITYSKNAEVNFDFNRFKDDLNAANIKGAIDNLPHMKSSTFMDKALEKANNEVFTVAAGMRTDEKIKKIIVLMTDGMQTIRLEPYTPLDEASRPLKEKNVTIFTLGVGPDIDISELEAMASTPNHVFSTMGFKDLKKKVGELQLQTCGCYKLLDIGIIWDESRSVSWDGFAKTKKAITALVEKLHVSPKESHVGIIRYGDFIKPTYGFSDNQDLSVVQKLIESIGFDVKQGFTRTSEAVTRAGQKFFKPGTPGNRDDVEDVAILFTDGQSGDGVDGANARFIKDTKTIVIGIGSSINESELKIFAHHHNENVIIAPTFNHLMDRIDDIVKATCAKD